jgi:hypothetical protein
MGWSEQLIQQASSCGLQSGMAAGMSGSIRSAVHDTQKQINSFSDFAKILKDVPVNDCRRIRNSLLKENAIQVICMAFSF